MYSSHPPKILKVSLQALRQRPKAAHLRLLQDLHGVFIRFCRLGCRFAEISALFFALEDQLGFVGSEVFQSAGAFVLGLEPGGCGALVAFADLGGGVFGPLRKKGGWLVKEFIW